MDDPHGPMAKLLVFRLSFDPMTEAETTCARSACSC